MDYAYLAQGYILGITVASTIGISGILCLQNMMSGRILIGLSSALAASLADMSCGVLVIFGLKGGQEILMAYQTVFHIIAGIFLCFLGLNKLFSKVVFQAEHKTSRNAVIAFGSVFFLSLVDPVSIVDFMGLCIGLTLEFCVTANVAAFIFGLFIGSATWWFSLCGLLLYFRANISVLAFERVQKIVGLGIFCFGLWILKIAWYGM